MTPYITLQQEKVMPAPGVSLAGLALVEPLSVGDHAIERSEAEMGDVVAVLGCGAVGLGAIVSAAFRGARVVAVDINNGKLNKARQCGANWCVNSEEEDLHQKLQDLTNGEGPDVIVEAVGLSETFVTAVEEVSFAGRVVYIGYVEQPVTYDATSFVKKELDILGSRNASMENFQNIISMIENGDVPIGALASEVVDFRRAGDALEEWHVHPERYTRVHVNVD